MVNKFYCKFCDFRTIREYYFKDHLKKNHSNIENFKEVIKKDKKLKVYYGLIKPIDITLFITSCGRPELLKVTLESFVKFNNYPIKEAVIIEARDHTRDCSYRSNQKGDSKFKSNYYANIAWALELFEFAKKFSIGIAGTLPDAKFTLPSHSYLSRALRHYKAPAVSYFLEAFTDKNCATEIAGNTIVAGSAFVSYFGNDVAQVDRKYGVDSFGDISIGKTSSIAKSIRNDE